MIILGLGGLRNDPACAVLKNGDLTAAVEQKKVARVMEPGELPREAIRMALDLSRASSDRVDCVALVRPFTTSSESELHLEIQRLFPNSRLVLVEHHAAHAASAFFVSPFDEAAVLTLDRLGDFRCGARWQGCGNELRVTRELYYPDSLGDIYGRVTELLGFHANADEHRVQWLSTTGNPDLHAPLFRAMLGTDSWPRVDRGYLNANRLGAGAFSEKFYARLGIEDGAAIPESMRADIAAGLQRAVEDTVLGMVKDAANVCLAGGLGFNALLVSALEREKNVFVQPMAGNAGTSIGAVLHAWHSVYQRTQRATLGDLCLGPSYTAEQ